MVKYAFIVVVSFVIGALLVEYKQYAARQIPAPVALLPDGGVYEGELQKGFFHGKGRLVWPNESYYEGEFFQGSFNGQGLLHTSEFLYRGEFSQGVARGEGSITYSNGDKYEGQVDFAQPEGYGVMETAGGSLYKGEFKKGLYDGQGELVNEKGSVYVGTFKQGLFDGEGVFTRYKQSKNTVKAQGATQQESTEKKVQLEQEKIIYSGSFVKGMFSGEGVWISGSQRYEGAFKNWLFHGEGLYTNEDESYSGSFEYGLYEGEGVYKHIDGSEYKGGFSKGKYHGNGSLNNELGDNYTGGFFYGVQHGQGKVSYGKALDGIKTFKGHWQHGQLVESSESELVIIPEQIVEHALQSQKEKLNNVLDSLDVQDDKKIDAYFVGVAGDGKQAVFRREVEYIRRLLDDQYDFSGKSMLLVNTRLRYEEYPLATPQSVADALQGVAKKMDLENDILFLYLTSHGSSDFQFELSQPGFDLENLSAKALGKLLNDVPVRHKVVIISSCYSGGFIPAIKNDTTMVITASEPDKVSFGCHDRSEMTYFGEAFFKDSFPQSNSFVDAFYKARDIVRGLEAKQGYPNSNPLLFKPKAIVAKLKQWREQLRQDAIVKAELATPSVN